MRGMKYAGYLAEHTDTIRDAYARGLGTRATAELLYEAGARANTSDPRVPAHALSREHHIANLRMMTLFVLQRLELRAPRKPRVLNARPGRDGAWTVPP
jgi:hypothetical protein